MTLTNSGQTTMKSSDTTPLVLDGGDAATPYGVNIRFRRADGQAAWALGSGVGGGSQRDFGLVDLLDNNTVRLFVDPAGRVGVGTTAPGSLTKLDAVGTIRARDDGGVVDRGVEVLYSGDVGNVFAYNRGANGGYMPLRLDGTSLYLNTMPGTGNVGIGTATLDARLNVSGTTKLDGNVSIGVTPRPERLAVLGADNVQATNVGAFFASDFSEGVGIGMRDVRQILPGHDLNVNAATTGQIRIGNASSGHIILAQGGGSVGVGTTPGTQTKLDTLGTVRARDIAGGDHGVELLSSGGIANVIGYERTQGNSGYRTLRLDGSTLSLNLNSPGNVGIGLAVPQQKLDVAGNIQASGLVIAGLNVNAGTDVNVGHSLSVTSDGTIGHDLTVGNNATVNQDLLVKSAIRAGTANPARKIADGSGCYYA
ncbi:MAG: hypothetical protein U0893_26610 [Chloroflexota bacterium]